MGINIMNSEGKTVLKIGDTGIEFISDSVPTETEIKNWIGNATYKLPEYIANTVIGDGEIKAPKIKAGTLGIYPTDDTAYASGAIELYANNYNGKQQACFYRLLYQSTPEDEIFIYAPTGARFVNDAPQLFDNRVEFYDVVDFSAASVIGLTAVWG